MYTGAGNVAPEPLIAGAAEATVAPTNIDNTDMPNTLIFFDHLLIKFSIYTLNNPLNLGAQYNLIHAHNMNSAYFGVQIFQRHDKSMIFI